MKTFLADIIPKIQRYSQLIDNVTLLTNQHWVLIDNVDQEKQVFIFRQNNMLLISKNGSVEKGHWEYLGNKAILIEYSNHSTLFKHGFFDENLLALKIDSKDEYALFINESKYEGDLNTSSKVVSYLKTKYLTGDDSLILDYSCSFRSKTGLITRRFLS